MRRFTSILVDIDATAQAQPALEHAVRLARGIGARLKIVDIVSLPWEAQGYLRAELERDLMTRRRDRLARIADGIRGVTVSWGALPGPAGQALVQEVVRSRQDLLVRSQARDLAAPRPQPDGPVNLQLFRTCPCPVWAVGSAVMTDSPKIVAAVHASADDPREQEMNARVIGVATAMADAVRGSVVLVEAWRPFGELGILNHTNGEEFAAHIRDAQRAAVANLHALRDSSGRHLAAVRLELYRGDPVNVIPQYAVANGADMVVVGTSGRTGVARLLMGNTADRLLERLPCSIVAVKPDGFVSPVRLGVSA
jgi:nucleotide-binding universal stress UspA family protein